MEQQRHPIHKMLFGLFSVTVPPVAGQYHGRYKGKSHILLFDTLLSLAMLSLFVWNIVLVTTRTPIVDSTLSVTVDGPAHSTNGTTTDFTVTLTNNGEKPIQETTVELTYPSGFTYVSASQEPTSETHALWDVVTVRPGSTATITITGTVLGAEQQAHLVRALARYQSTAGEKTTTGLFHYTTAASPLTVTTNVSSEQTSATVTATITNAGTVPLHDLQLSVDEPAGVTRTNTTLSPGDPSSLGIDALEPGKSATLTLTEKSKNGAQTAAIHITVFQRSENDQLVQATTTARVPLPAAENAAAIIENPGTVPAITAEAHYTSAGGLQFGFGPIPPRVGALTVYRLFWTVNVDHVYTNITLHAKVPETVTWHDTASVSANGNLTYTASTRTVSWTVTGDATQGPVLAASFDLGLMPIAAQRGTSPLLLEPTTVTFTDTNGTVQTITAPSVTTDLHDSGLTGKGTVE